MGFIRVYHEPLPGGCISGWPCGAGRGVRNSSLYEYLSILRRKTQPL